MGVACKLAGDDAPLPRRKRPYCNARKGNALPPPEERPEYRQVARAAAGLKSRLRKVCGLRCGFATTGCRRSKVGTALIGHAAYQRA